MQTSISPMFRISGIKAVAIETSSCFCKIQYYLTFADLGIKPTQWQWILRPFSGHQWLSNERSLWGPSCWWCCVCPHWISWIHQTCWQACSWWKYAICLGYFWVSGDGVLWGVRLQWLAVCCWFAGRGHHNAVNAVLPYWHWNERCEMPQSSLWMVSVRTVGFFSHFHAITYWFSCVVSQLVCLSVRPGMCLSVCLSVSIPERRNLHYVGK